MAFNMSHLINGFWSLTQHWTLNLHNNLAPIASYVAIQTFNFQVVKRVRASELFTLKLIYTLSAIKVMSHRKIIVQCKMAKVEVEIILSFLNSFVFQITNNNYMVSSNTKK